MTIAWRWFGLLAAFIAGMSLPPSGSANEPSIHIRSADIVTNGDSYVLDAAFQIELGETLEEALHRGLTLHFVTEFEVLYERWYLLNLWNKSVASFEQRYRLSFNALTRQYRFTSGSLTRNVESLAEALNMMARIKARPIASREDIEPGVAYVAQLRLRLDSSQLPKPFQLSSIGSKSWNVSSDWYRWTFRP